MLAMLLTLEFTPPASSAWPRLGIMSRSREASPIQVLEFKRTDKQLKTVKRRSVPFFSAFGW